MESGQLPRKKMESLQRAHIILSLEDDVLVWGMNVYGGVYFVKQGYEVLLDTTNGDVF